MSNEHEPTIEASPTVGYSSPICDPPIATCDPPIATCDPLIATCDPPIATCDPPDPPEIPYDSSNTSSNTSSPKETNVLIQKDVKSKKEKKPLTDKQKLALERGRQRLAEKRRLEKEVAKERRLKSIEEDTEEPDFPSWCSIM
jgi:hypothetical protein